ncbi:hypothetical protein RND71_003764 [Anisodus tanguticus]|uniref:Uncharacterized protein n=1 Tax=Anisodus tanguticus TaxID=243964 RepID=A0AAE1VP06_9SOLA|nr:hypothetical protein RND71_003764 [Anisodus tanguticus]
MFPTYESQSEVVGGDFDLQNEITDSDVIEFDFSYIVPKLQNSCATNGVNGREADQITKSDELQYITSSEPLQKCAEKLLENKVVDSGIEEAVLG